MDDLSRRLLARYQKGLPICAEPYRRMAETLGCSEAEVLERLRRLEADGALSRVGPVLRHQRAGASTLAALAVPEERLQRVAERISQYAEVNLSVLQKQVSYSPAARFDERRRKKFILTRPARWRARAVPRPCPGVHRDRSPARCPVPTLPTVSAGSVGSPAGWP